jgi:hypothetical protein
MSDPDAPQQTHTPDAGEPQGGFDPDRPAMLGKRFKLSMATGMLIGLVLALGAHAAIADAWYGGGNGWSWFLAAIGGLAVGGAITLFVYGTATDRTDTGTKPRGRADVSERGEWRRTLQRRRLRRGAPR